MAALTARLLQREPYTRVRIDEAASMSEARSSWGSTQRYRRKVIFEGLRQGVGTRQDFEMLNSYLTRHFGELDSFLLLDPEDNSVTAHGFAVGDGSTTAFQLQRALLGPIYDPTGGPWGTLSTPRTNLALWSQDLTNAVWTKTASSAALSTTLAPDGTASADKLIDTAANSQHFASTPVTLTSGVAYTLSMWVQAAGRAQVGLNVAGGSYCGAIFDLAAVSVLASSVVSGTTTSITAHPTLAGWYRCAITFTAPSTGATTLGVYLCSAGAVSYLGDGSSGALVWGVLFEASASVGPYSYLLGASVTSLLTTSAAVTATPSFYPNNTAGFEPCSAPAPGPKIYVGGVLKTLTTDYSIGATGLVTFTVAPAAAAVLTWTGSYYSRVRMDGPLTMQRLVQGLYAIPTLGLVSVL